MKGRPPKDPEQRQRRNKIATASTLDPTAARVRRAPLPRSLFGVDDEGKAIPASPNVRRWWRVIWRSPMAARWLEADVEGLYLVARLRQEFDRKPTQSLAAEIRNQEQRFGLDTFARKRLDWRIAAPTPPTAAVDLDPKPADQASAPRPPELDDDPRDALLEFPQAKAG